MLSQLTRVNDSPKRVQTLYRVSTIGQVDDNDIPMQLTACREFIDKQGWKLIKEYTELGISGYKNPSIKRCQIQQLMMDAELGLFDVLLIFMFDRLGRKDDDTPFVVEWFVEHGIEVWSVVEGQQKFDNHTDKLVNYLRYWQSTNESIKTSIRVNEKHIQMTREGIFRGGTAPYGFQLIPSGKYNKKNKNLRKMIIDKKEATVVQKIFKMAYEEGLGGNRIATRLNEEGIPSKNGSGWRSSVINYMIKNPIYCGYLTYNKSSSAIEGVSRNKSEDWILSDYQNPGWVIVDKDIWHEIQTRRIKRDPALNRPLDANITIKTQYPETTKSPLLFISMIKCGYCGHPLTTTYQNKKYTAKDGKETIYKKALYRCSGKAQKVANCNGQTIYNQKRLETAILDKVNVYIDQLKQVDLQSEILKFKHENVDAKTIELKKIRKNLEHAYEELSAIKKEVAKSIMNKSAFTPELLSLVINEKEAEIKEFDEKCQELTIHLNVKRIEVNDMKMLQRYIPIWKEEFENGNTDEKKDMLSKLIDNITVYIDRVEINVKLFISEFIACQLHKQR